MDKVFGDYDQAGLDAEYDNRAKVPDSVELLRRSADLSRKWRQRQTGELNMPFGPGADEVLDIFPAKAGPAPIRVFIHGGYWRMMPKDDYSYVACALTPQGCATVAVNYGLIPTIDMDELVRQCRSAGVSSMTNLNSMPKRRPATAPCIWSPVGQARCYGDEWPEYLRQSEALAAAWRRHGIDVEVIVMPGQNYFTTVDQLSDPDAALSRLIRR